MPRSRTLILTVAASALLGGVVLIGLGMRDTPGLASERPSTAGSAGGRAAVAPGKAGPDPAELARQERVRREQSLTKALDEVAKDAPDFAVAVLDRKTGQLYEYHGKDTFETASVIKVDVLSALLLRAQDTERDLSSSELSLATSMIRNSDNDATSSLFRRIGYTKGLSSANRRLGLSATDVDESWGLTKTTAVDQTQLLSQLAADHGPLDADSRELANELMTTVEKDQRWGVSAAAADGEQVALKNGWLQRDTENNKWIINSIGRINDQDSDVTMAVLSHGHKSMDSGIDVVERVARLTREHLTW